MSNETHKSPEQLAREGWFNVDPRKRVRFEGTFLVPFHFIQVNEIEAPGRPHGDIYPMYEKSVIGCETYEKPVWFQVSHTTQ